MESVDLKQMREKFQIYVMTMSDVFLDLEDMVTEILGLEKILNYSLDSLDFLEIVLLKKFANHSLGVLDKDKLIEVVSSYMGEIVRKKLNGKWDLCVDETDFDFGYPMVTRLDGLPPEFGWSPIQDVFNFQDIRKKGLLKQATNSVLQPYS